MVFFEGRAQRRAFDDEGLAGLRRNDRRLGLGGGEDGGPAEDVAGLHAQDRDRSPLGNQSPQGKTAGDQDPHFDGFFAFPENDLVRLEVRNGA